MEGFTVTREHEEHGLSYEENMMGPTASSGANFFGRLAM
jgi:hypothetical protein